MQTMNRAQRAHQHRGQSVVEYAVLFSVVAAVVIGMNLYVKRGAQAKFKQVSDHLALTTGDDGANKLNAGTTVKLQYEPYYTSAGTFNTATNNAQNEKMTAGGLISRTGIDDNTTRTGSGTQSADLTKDDAWQ